MASWLRKILQWLGFWPKARGAIPRTPPVQSVTRAVTRPVTRPVTPPVTPADEEMLTDEHVAQAIARDEAFRAGCIKLLAWRKTPKRRRSQNAERQARWRAKSKAQDPEGFRRRKKEEDAARRARKKAARAAAQVASQVGVGADVVDFLAARALRAAEVPQAVVDQDQVEQQAQRALPD
jgi:primosomal protein N'